MADFCDLFLLSPFPRWSGLLRAWPGGSPPPVIPRPGSERHVRAQAGQRRKPLPVQMSNVTCAPAGSCDITVDQRQRQLSGPREREGGGGGGVIPESPAFTRSWRVVLQCILPQQNTVAKSMAADYTETSHLSDFAAATIDLFPTK